YNLAWTATLKQILARPEIDARLACKNTKLDSIRSDLPDIDLNTTINLSGEQSHQKVALDPDADSAQYSPVAASGHVDYTPDAVTIEQLRVTRPNNPMQLVADGTVALAADHAMDMQLQWQQLSWPLNGEADYLSKRGQMQLT